MGICMFHGLGCERNYKGAYVQFRYLVFTPGFANSIPDVEYYYGECLYNGYGVEKDREGGLKNINYAANYGSSLARIKLGKLTLDGEVGSNTDYFNWVKTAADKNNKEARQIMGNLCLKGIVCEKNIEMSFEYLK